MFSTGNPDDLVTSLGGLWQCQGDKPVKQLSLHLNRVCAEAKFYCQILAVSQHLQDFFWVVQHGSTRSSLLLMKEILQRLVNFLSQYL